jgi:Glycosyltransferase family 87
MPASDSENRSPSHRALLALALAMMGAASMLYYHQRLLVPRALEAGSAKNLRGIYAFGNDFYPVWLTSKECLQQRRDPYSAETTVEIQKGLFGRTLDPHIPTDPTDLRMFAHSAFTILLLWPMAELPFPVARIVLVVLLGAMTLTSIMFWTRALSWHLRWHQLAVIFLLTMCCYPTLEGLYAGQLGLMVAFLLAASILALQRGRLLLAGILMALTAIKPQMTLLAGFYLVLWSSHERRSRWRFGVGLFSTLLLLVSASLAVWPHWIQSWAHVVLQYHRYARPALVGEVFASALGPHAAGPATVIMIAAGMVVAVILAWSNRAAAADSLEFWLTLSVLLSITAITLLPGQAVYDHVILLPGALLLARWWPSVRSTWILRALMATGLAILLWPWFASCSLIVLRPLLSHQQFYSAAVLALPLRTAAAFPFVVLGLLALALRQNRRPGGKSSVSVPI